MACSVIIPNALRLRSGDSAERRILFALLICGSLPRSRHFGSIRRHLDLDSGIFILLSCEQPVVKSAHQPQPWKNMTKQFLSSTMRLVTLLAALFCSANLPA